MAAAKADSRLEDSKPAQKPFESLEDLKLASKPAFKCSLSSQLWKLRTLMNRTIAQSFHHNAGYKLCEMSHTSKEAPLTIAEMKKTLNMNHLYGVARKLPALAEATSFVYKVATVHSTQPFFH